MRCYLIFFFVFAHHTWSAELHQQWLSYLEFGVWVEDHLCQVCDGTIVHHGLGQFWCVFGDVAEGGSCDAFEGQLRLQKTHHQQRHSTRIHDRLSQHCTVMQSGVENKHRYRMYVIRQ